VDIHTGILEVLHPIVGWSWGGHSTPLRMPGVEFWRVLHPKTDFEFNNYILTVLVLFLASYSTYFRESQLDNVCGAVKS